MKRTAAIVILGALWIGCSGLQRPATGQSGGPEAGETDETLAAVSRAGMIGGAFDGRRNNRSDLRRRYGGEGTERAVDLGLEWLARHQTPREGGWDADGFEARCKGDACDGRGHSLHDTGLTGLALLAFLGAGHTYRAGPFQTNVDNGLRYLARSQDREGCFGPRTGHFIYSHAVAALAMAETYAMTNSPLLRRTVERSLRFIYRAQNPDPAGEGNLAWRYTVRPGDNDTSVTGWIVKTLNAAEACGLKAPDEVLDGARSWLERMTDPDTGRCGYVKKGVSPVRMPGREEKWPRSRSEAITAVGMLSRVFLGENPYDSKPIQQGAALCLERLPVWNEKNGSIDHYYWYFGTLAMFQVGGRGWDTWNDAMKKAVVGHQRQEGCQKGSWDPSGPWGEDGGRVYSTALLTLCLEVYYRYAKKFESAGVPAGESGSPQTIRVKLTRGREGCVCLVNAKKVGVLPACAGQAYEKITALRKADDERAVEIAPDADVPYDHVVAILDEGIRWRRARRKAGTDSSVPEIRLVVPVDAQFSLVPRVELIAVEPSAEDRVGVRLPVSRTVAPAEKRTRNPLTVDVTHDGDTGASRMHVEGRVISPDELLHWIFPIARSRISPRTLYSRIPMLIRCDRDAPIATVGRLLAACAHPDMQVCSVRLAVVRGTD